MGKYIPAIKKFLLLLLFCAMALLPQYLPIGMENKYRLANIFMLLGGAIFYELLSKISGKKGVWLSLTSKRDKIVIIASLLMLTLSGAVFNFPLITSNKSIIAAIISSIAFYTIILIGGSDMLKTMLTGHQFIGNSTDKDENK